MFYLTCDACDTSAGRLVLSTLHPAWAVLANVHAAIDGDTTMIPQALLKDIKKTLRDKHDCGTQDKIDRAMLRPNDFKDGEVWMMVKLGYTNPPRDLVKRRLNRMDAAALKMEHAHTFWG